MHYLSCIYFLYLLKGCPPGHYGLECESNCVGHCNGSEGCNHTNGLCDNGCGDGWTGENCTRGEIFLFKESNLMDKLFRIN